MEPTNLPPRLLPLDRLDGVLSPVVYRFDTDELAALEQLVFQPPRERMTGMMQIVMRAAKRQPDIRRVLAAPNVIDTLRREAANRNTVAAAEQPAAKAS